MDWLEHMIFWLPNALINRESKTYCTKIANYQRKKILFFPSSMIWNRNMVAEVILKKENHNHNKKGVYVY